MTDESSMPPDDQLAAWLAACDDRLAAGEPRSSIDTSLAPDDMQPRMLRDLECVELLRSLWPNSNRAAADGANGNGAHEYPPQADDVPKRIGRFEIRRELGQGGYGVVFLAYDPQLGREVALKIPRAEALVSSQLRSRFQYEARIAAGLDHPHIVPVYDAGELGAIYYIASAYCPGVTLAEWLQTQQPVALDIAAELVAVLADAVQHAHSRGVLHRDLKPGNIILSPRDESRTPDSLGSRLDFIPRLTDFGLAKLIEATEQGQTRTHAVLGTPEYMSPEQATGRSREITTASDVYGLGVILYELIAGRPPFRAGTSLATLRQVEKDVPVPLARLRIGVPRDLETICLKCLEKEPARRYLSAHALAEDLRRYLAGEPVEARPAGRVERVARWCRRNRVEAGLIATIALVLLAGAFVSTYFWLQTLGRRQAEIDAAVAIVEAREARLANVLSQRHLYLSKMLLAQTAWEEVRLQDLDDLLDSVRPEHTSGQDDRRFEWYYWQRAGHGDLMTLRADGPAYCVRFSPDGKHLAFAGETGKARIVDRQTGKELGVLTGHDGPIWGLSFSRDGKRLATASDDGTVRIWNAEAGEQLAVLKGHTSDVTAVAFAPDGIHVASCGEDHTVRIWNSKDGAELLTYRGHTGAVWNVAFSRDGKTVVSCGDDGTRVWRADDGETIKAMKGHEDAVYCTDISPDGSRVVTASEDASVKIWDLSSDHPLVELSGHTRGVRSVQFSPDGRRLISAGRDGAIRFWDADTGRPLFVLGHKFMVDSAVFSADGRFVASVCRDGAVKLWNANREPQPTTFRDHAATVEAATFSPDGLRIASVGGDGVVLVRDVDSGSVVFEQRDDAGREADVVFDRSGRLLAVSRGANTIWVYDVQANQQLHELRASTDAIHALAFSRDGQRLASAGKDGVVQLWDPLAGKLIDSLPPISAEVFSVAFSSDGTSLVVAQSDHVATVWDLQQRSIRLTLQGHTGPVYSAAFNNDGTHIATGAHDMTARIWNARDGAALLTLAGHRYSLVSSVAFSPDGTRLATASGGLDKRIKLWDLATGQEVLTLKGHTGAIRTVQFSGDGHRLVSASVDGTVKVWDARPLDKDRP